MSISASPRRRAFVLALAALLFAFAVPGHAAERFPGIGRAPTPAEIAAWNIDVRPDFAGLPRGSGSVARGQDIWDAQCASCHGTFGESNEVFNPIIGGTTPDDVARGHVRSLTTSELQRTTLMKLPGLAPMWDYIRRAMPWNAPKSLSNDDVYAVTAYILNLADLVPADFVLSDANIRETEKRLPNRYGMTRAHGLWTVDGKPDVRNAACMRDCGPAPRVQSFLPDYARNAHGNLALQNRDIGGVRGADTTRPPLAPGEVRMAHAAAHAGAASGPAALASQLGCLACHGLDKKLIGPGFREVAARYRIDAADAAAITRLARRILSGGTGNWGDVQMPAQTQLGESGADALAHWIAAGAPGP